jgi:DNA-binding MarR family transcriptional regulator
MKQKVLPIDVLAYLQEHDKATRAQIAGHLNCSPVTISNKVATLIKDGENIGFNNKGLFLYSKEDMKNESFAIHEQDWGRRIVNSLTQWARRGNNTRPILIAARQQFGKELTKEERKHLRANLLMLTRVVDAVDLDEELKE